MNRGELKSQEEVPILIREECRAPEVRVPAFVPLGQGNGIMRITNNMVLRNSLSALQSNRSAIDTLQGQISSGSKLSAASDDPAAASEVMTSSSSLTAIDQYKRNINTATSRNTIEGSALDQLNSLLARAKELATESATGTATTASRAAAAQEMGQLFNSAVALAGSKFGDQFIFGGDSSTTPPFTQTGSGATLDFTSTTPAGTQNTTISAGQSLVATHSGQQVFADSGVLAALRDATKALTAGDQASITNVMPSIDTAFDNIQTLTGEQGARSNALSAASSNLDTLKANLTAYKSSLADTDVETAVTELATKQTSYSAAMLAISKVLGMSLTEYLH